MTRSRKAMGAAVAAAVLAGLVPGSSGPQQVLSAASTALAVPPAFEEALAAAEAADGGMVEAEIQVESPGALDQLERSVSEAGGEVLLTEGQFARIRVPAGAVETLLHEAPVVAVGVDQALQPEAQAVSLPGEAATATEVRQLAAVSLDPLGVPQFRAQSGAQGRGVVVAVIDSGVDPSHPDLLTTSDGRAKIIDWKDFTGEGEVKTPNLVSWGAVYTAPDGRRYTLPARPGVSTGARFGYWDEYKVAGPYIGRDLDRNGNQTDRFGVLLADAGSPGAFDTVYVDTNNDGDFRDETPLRLYTESLTGGWMGKPRDNSQPDRQVAFAVAELDRGGGWVRLGFDGYGHGTEVAGILAGYNDAGMEGVAPGAQIMALKALGSGGSGDWFAIKQAIRYAAQNGADIINISVGGLAAAASRFDSTASEWLNEIARQYGVLIIIAADNSGPGLSSGATLGNPSEVMAVGAYYSPAMWQRDFGVVVPSEGIWSLSGMGPRSDGSYVPSVVAPGGSPAPSPYWIHNTGYTTAVGTSIATPHVSGVAALLMEAARAQGANDDRLSVKLALEMGARSVPGYGVYEQGHGLIAPIPSWGHLQQMDGVSVLMARSANGDGGLLARSYRPGSTSFWLTNLDERLARVGILPEESWVTAGSSSLTLPPNVARELTVQMDPPDEPGVHSTFLTVTNPDWYGPSLNIPITYVRPLELTGTPARYTASERLEVGRYRRYFFAVEPGTATLSISVRLPLGSEGYPQGTAQVHLFRPDGQAVYSGTIGAGGVGSVAAHTTPDPVEGVWEVVVTAMPDARGQVLNTAYSLNVQADADPLAGQTLRFSLPAGDTATFPVTVTNTFGAFTGQLEAIGLTRRADGTTGTAGEWRMIKGTQSLVEEFTLSSYASRMRVETSSPVPADVDLNLYLYYLDPQAGWVPRGQSATGGTSREVIEAENLPPGRYQTLAVVNGTAAATYQYQYRRLTGLEDYALVSWDDTAERAAGESWTVDLRVRAPSQPGRYEGYLLLRDTEHDRTLGWFPVEVSVGQPELLVEPMVAQLRRGQPSTAVLELRDAKTGQLTDATVTVNEQRFVSRNGQVAVPISTQDAVAVLQVEADDPSYQFLRTEVRLPVRERWGLLPVGADQGPELTWWRQKVLSQLP